MTAFFNCCAEEIYLETKSAGCQERMGSRRQSARVGFGAAKSSRQRNEWLTLRGAPDLGQLSHTRKRLTSRSSRIVAQLQGRR